MGVNRRPCPGRSGQRQNPQATALRERAGRPKRPTESSQSSNLPCLTRSLVPRTAKNGASLLIWRPRRRARQPGSLDIKPCRSAFCNRAQPPGSSAKWRFCPSKKRHKAPFSATFSSIFPVFFQRAWPKWRSGRECDPEMRTARLRYPPGGSPWPAAGAFNRTFTCPAFAISFPLVSTHASSVWYRALAALVVAGAPVPPGSWP